MNLEKLDTEIEQNINLEMLIPLLIFKFLSHFWFR